MYNNCTPEYSWVARRGLNVLKCTGSIMQRRSVVLLECVAEQKMSTERVSVAC